MCEPRADQIRHSDPHERLLAPMSFPDMAICLVDLLFF